MPQQRITVLVSGGSGGIGQSVVKMLRRKGHRVAVADRDVPEEADCFVACDLSDLEATGSIVTEAQRALGSVDALVLCAAKYDASTLDQCTLESFTAAVRVNLESPMALIKAWLALEPDTEHGTIILLGSAAGHVGSRDPAYSASKAGLLGLARSLALNLTNRGLTVFSVSPGVVDTAMSRAQGEQRRSAQVARTMLKRAAKPEEIAEVIVWLLESRPHYMSGADVNISNGIAW
jgi:NAD(P)-dependent dehydrogenase (short-subunit alcohol dehydrogenase family)